MKIQGFKYSPNPEKRWEQTIEKLGSLELTAFRSDYGYGISTLLKVEAFLSFKDPNLNYLRNLDEPTRVAFEEALDGPNGCREKVNKQVLVEPAKYFALETELEEAAASSVTTKEARPALIAWRNCMRKDGLERLLSPTDAEQSILRETQALSNRVSEIESEENFLKLSADLRNDLGTVQSSERLVASRDFYCRETSGLGSLVEAAERATLSKHAAYLKKLDLPE